MKKMLAMLLAVLMIAGCMTTAALAADYSDTAEHWAANAIAEWSKNGVVQGNNNKFNPDAFMTRAEAAQTMANLLKLSETADFSAFTDVDADAWYADAVAKCVKAGIMKGVSETKMAPDDSITREMFFTMFARALGIAPETNSNKVADASNVSDWARDYINALVNHGYIKGVEATEKGAVVAPAKLISRAAVVSVMDQTICVYADKGGEYTAEKNGVILVVTSESVKLKGNATCTVAVAVKNAKVNVSGLTDIEAIIVNADNAAITGVPAGAAVTVSDKVSGTNVNGTPVKEGTTHVVSGGSNNSGFVPVSHEYQVGVVVKGPRVDVTLTSNKYSTAPTMDAIVNSLMADEEVDKNLGDLYDKVLNNSFEVTSDGKNYSIITNEAGVLTVKIDGATVDVAVKLTEKNEEYLKSEATVLAKAKNLITETYYKDAVEAALKAAYEANQPSNYFVVDGSTVKLLAKDAYKSLLTDRVTKAMDVYKALLAAGLTAEDAAKMLDKCIERAAKEGVTVTVTEGVASQLVGATVDLAALKSATATVDPDTNAAIVATVSGNTSVVIDNLDNDRFDGRKDLVKSILAELELDGNYKIEIKVKEF